MDFLVNSKKNTRKFLTAGSTLALISSQQLLRYLNCTTRSECLRLCNILKIRSFEI